MTSPAQAQPHWPEMGGGLCSSGPFLSSLSYPSELGPRSRPWTKLSVPFSISSWMALQGNASPAAAHVTLYSYIGCSSTCFALHPAVFLQLGSSRETISEWTQEPAPPLSRSGLPTSQVTQAAGGPHTELSPEPAVDVPSKTDRQRNLLF